MKFDLFFTCVIWVFVLIFFILSSVKCRRVRIFPSLCVVLSITFFTLLSPVGEVILTIGSLNITRDALLLGLRRSGILVEMVFFSRFVISSEPKKSNLWHTGKLGQSITEVFYWLNLLTKEKIELKRGHIIKKIDERLLAIWNLEKLGEKQETNIP